MRNSTMFFWTAFCLCIHFATAQQNPDYTLYKYHMNLVNPAYAGAGGTAQLALGLRSQWAGIQGAPESRSALFSMPVGANLGLGLSILSDQVFIEKQTWVALDFSYKLNLDDRHVLYLGLKAGGNSYSANTTRLVTYDMEQDRGLMGIRDGLTHVNFGVGAYLKHSDYFISLSSPKLLTFDYPLEKGDNNVYNGVFDKMNVYLAGGYDFKLGENLKFQVSSLLRYTGTSPLSLNVTSIFDFGLRFKLGTSYRINEALGGIFMFDVSSGFGIGYVHEVPVNNVENNGSHELFMRFSI
ncbi:PorP/SprF family type IX secretion system membrane protein [Flagellimonas onchidii]|uniref:PorP/SprF family type IX secretion system membrane protein n=1 Tax=Flagellimonas onchidii TaxID=2562684 RepID=UPI0010A6941C|nr:PorP/SprF family type IX secretion system membrane protein [Allomuricauda onchidii]